MTLVMDSGQEPCSLVHKKDLCDILWLSSLVRHDATVTMMTVRGVFPLPRVDTWVASDITAIIECLSQAEGITGGMC